MHEILKDIDIHESIKMDKHLFLKNRIFVYTRKKKYPNIYCFLLISGKSTLKWHW